MRSIIIAAIAILLPALCLAGPPAGAVSQAERAEIASMPAIVFTAPPPAAEQARDVARAKDWIRHLAEAAARQGSNPHYYAGPAGIIEALWPGYAIARVSSVEVCSAINVLSSMGALENASAVCLGTDAVDGREEYTVVYASR